MNTFLKYSIISILAFYSYLANAQEACFNLNAKDYSYEDKYNNLCSSYDPIKDSIFWDIYKINNPKDGYYTEKWDSLLLKMEGNIINGKREGEWKFQKRGFYWERSCISIYLVSYQNNIKNGSFKSLTINGKDTSNIFSGLYANDKRSGKFTSVYYRNITDESNYKNGFLDGKFISYFRDGKIRSISNYKEGNRYGEWLSYDKKYKTDSIYLIYKNIYYNQTGTETLIEFNYKGDTIELTNRVDSLLSGRQIESDGNYIYSNYNNGKLNGTEYEINEHKDTLRKTFYKEGEKDGIDIEFYENGDTSIIRNFINGKRDGRFVSYDEKKRIEYINNYKNDLQEGESISYNTKKKFLSKEKRYISEIENYKNGQLEGTCKSFYDNNKIEYEIIFKNNLPFTSVAAYSAKGKKLDAGTLKDGNGTFNRYYSDGKLKYSFMFVDGKCKGKFFGIRRDASAGIEGEVFDIETSNTSKKRYFSDYNDLIFTNIRAKFPYGITKSFNKESAERTSNDKYYTSIEEIYDSAFLKQDNYYNAVGALVESNLYLNKKRDKLSKTFYNNGQLEKAGKYVVVERFFRTQIEKDSTWTSYYETGTVKATEQYNKGKLAGISKYYDELGVLKREYHIANDSNEFSIFNGDTINRITNYLRQGKWIGLAGKSDLGCNDMPNSIQYFNNDKPTGTWAEYDKANNLKEQYFWKDTAVAYFQKYSPLTKTLYQEGSILNQEIRFGKWKFYDYKKGYLKAEGNYLNDQYSGDWISYKKNGKVKAIIPEIKVYTFLNPPKSRLWKLLHHKRRGHLRSRINPSF
ncbi:MAG: hypothetical protein WCK02_17125 [Bacteroidota bacterium]